MGEDHQSDVLREEIDGVVAGHGDANFEFSWQVGVAVERFSLTSGVDPAFRLALSRLFYRLGWFEAIAEVAIHPKVEIRPFSCFWAQQVGNLVS